LADLSSDLILPEPVENSDPSWFGFIITVKESARFSRNELVAHLEKNKIQTRMLFAGNLIKHPCFDQMRAEGTGYRVAGELTHTDEVMNNGFWIGVYPGMSKAMLDFMVAKIKAFCVNEH
jgi:CDP-4-dehydro-6-deoxyglucose reductase, E1